MLTTKQREMRKKHIGASEVAALFGLNPFKTGADIWLSKCFETEKTDVQSNAIEMGNEFEAPLLAWAAKELNVKVSGDPESLFAVCAEHPIFSATLDERIVGLSEAIEAKTTSMSDEYGEPGTDQVPDRVNLQCQTQMLCHVLDKVHVVVLMGRNGLKRELYHVNRDEKIISAIIQRGEWFWREFVETKHQPPELDENGQPLFGLGNLDIIKRVQRQPQTWAEVPLDLIVDWETKRDARLNAEKTEKEALSRILTPLGDAEGVMMDGRTFTYFATIKQILDQSKLKTEYPEIYKSMLRESVNRTPRIKGGVA